MHSLYWNLTCVLLLILFSLIFIFSRTLVLDHHLDMNYKIHVGKIERKTLCPLRAEVLGTLHDKLKTFVVSFRMKTILIKIKGHRILMHPTRFAAFSCFLSLVLMVMVSVVPFFHYTCKSLWICDMSVHKTHSKALCQSLILLWKLFPFLFIYG